MTKLTREQRMAVYSAQNNIRDWKMIFARPSSVVQLGGEDTSNYRQQCLEDLELAYDTLRKLVDD